jgi:hypothetical protein
MPTPVSVTSTRIAPVVWLVMDTRTVPPLGVNLQAFDTRLHTICANHAAHLSQFV